MTVHLKYTKKLALSENEKNRNFKDLFGEKVIVCPSII